MKGLIYQLKSVRKDKFCIMTFFLPIVVAAALNIAGSIDLSSLGEYYFCVVSGAVTDETREWLTRYGDVTVCQTREEWLSAIKEPSTNLIGVEMDKTGIKTTLSAVTDTAPVSTMSCFAGLGSRTVDRWHTIGIPTVYPG